MSLRVIGAGLGRTGTHSLKIALEQLLGGRCYHMLEVLNRPDQAEAWFEAANGRPPEWSTFLADYSATVDWPAAAFWSELRASSPDAVVLLSVRDAEGWWKSASETIFQVIERGAPPSDPGAGSELGMITSVLERRFTPDWRDRDGAIAAYEAHNDCVRRTTPADRLVEWRPGDGWGPICAALELPEPAEPFPHVNSTADFRAMTGLDATPGPA